MPDVRPYYDMMQQAGREFNVDPRFGEAVLESESGGNPTARSPVGAQGLMQLMPGTERELANELHIKNPNANDPDENIRMGMFYLSQLLHGFHGDKSLAAAGYNAGGGAVEKYHGIPPYKETQNYVKAVMGRYDKMSGSSGGWSEGGGFGEDLTPDDFNFGNLAKTSPEDSPKKNMFKTLIASLNPEGEVTENFLTYLTHSLSKALPWEKLFGGH